MGLWELVELRFGSYVKRGVELRVRSGVSFVASKSTQWISTL